MLAATLLLITDSRVAAQGATTGSIRGQVVSTEGAPVPNVQVSARNVETGLVRGVLTGANGRYGILLLPPGTYTVTAQSIGFAGATAQNVRVTAGEAVPLDLTLAPQAVAIEGVTVTTVPTRVDASRGGVVQTVDPEQIENLPVAGRDFTDFLNLSPLVSPQPQVGTGGQFSIGGARTSGTNIQIDGADANNVFFGENRGSSRTPFAFSLESIREFQLITNGFDVEYGNYQGGVMNAITRGGTNQLQASGFYFRRDERLTAQDFQGRDPREYEVNQFGLNVSGPVIRDRLHFFASVDAQRKDQPIFAGTPTSANVSPERQALFVQTLQSQYGVPDPQRFFGEFTQAENNLVLFGRIDWSFNDNHRLTLRQNYADFEQTNDRISSNEAITHGGPFLNESWSTVGELNSVLGSNAFNVLRVQWSDEDRPRVPNDEAGFVPDFSVLVEGNQRMFFGGDGIIFRNRLQERKLQVVDNFTYRAGAHTLKVGTNNIFSNTINTFWLNGQGRFVYNSFEDFLADRPTSYSRNLRACPVPLTTNAAGEQVVCPQYNVPEADFGVAEWSLYAQDEFQVTDRLLVTGGLRYGGTSFRDEPLRVPAVEGVFQTPDGPLVTGIVPGFTGLSPRLAFTYDLGGNQQVVRGGVGVLVGRAPTVLAGNVFQTEEPLLQIDCRGADIPSRNMPEWLSAPSGELNPAACRSGAAPTGRPEFSFFSPDFALPRTTKANLGYSHLLPTGTRLGLDLIYSYSWNNFRVLDLNLNPLSDPDRTFTLDSEMGRPVFVPRAGYNPRFGAGTVRLTNPAFFRVFYNVSDGRAEAYNVNLELEQRLGERFQFATRYGWNRAFDNSSFSCCTSFEGFTGEPTAGDPNFVGTVGDDVRGAWGPSRFERRHVIANNFLLRAPFGINVTGIWRSQSGTPWTPTVNGDINADGVTGNDRAFISRNLQFNTQADRDRFEQILNDFPCIAEQEGRIAARNSCRNPWWHSVDMRVSWDVPTVGTQRAEVMLELFNLLHGINRDWGQFRGVFGSGTNLLRTERFDAATGNVVYSVVYDPDADPGRRGFGEARPVGFDPFQFQAQLGVRYRFGATGRR